MFAKQGTGWENSALLLGKIMQGGLQHNIRKGWKEVLPLDSRSRAKDPPGNTPNGIFQELDKIQMEAEWWLMVISRG